VTRTMARLALRAVRIRAPTAGPPMYAHVGRRLPELLSADLGQRLLGVLVAARGRLVHGAVRGAHLAICPFSAHVPGVDDSTISPAEVRGP
jgi:hypothetical protein